MCYIAFIVPCREPDSNPDNSIVAYHGYWPRDLYSINSHFGTPEDLKKLSDALHARGMVSYTLTSLQDSAGLTRHMITA
jgi:hypothetical protein